MLVIAFIAWFWYSNISLGSCSIPDEPLVFVHVALVKEIASSMQYIRDETELMHDETQANAAIFYSISSTQKGLQVFKLIVRKYCWGNPRYQCVFQLL